MKLINMKIKNIGLLLLLLLFSFFVFYVRSYYNNTKIEQSCSYYNMIESLKFNDKRSARFYSKQILNASFKTVYYDLALLLMYKEIKEKKKDKKIFRFCRKIVKDKKLGLTNVVEECNKFLYKNSN